MYLLDDTQVNYISGGAIDTKALWLTFTALTFGFYFLSEKETTQLEMKFQDFDNRLLNLESLITKQAEQLALQNVVANDSSVNL